VVTISFIDRLVAEGVLPATVHANIACGIDHWFTAVYVNASTPIVFLNHWQSVHVYGIYTDSGGIVYGQNILETLQDSLVVDQTTLAQYQQYLGALMAPQLFFVLVVAAIILGMVGTALFGYPRNYDPDEQDRVKKEMARYSRLPKIGRAFAWLFPVKIGNPVSRRHWFFWMNTATVALLLLLGITYLWYGLISTSLFTYATVFIYVYIFAMLVVLDRDLVPRAFNRVYKAITGKTFSISRVGER
jgi:magnesium-transporting ATPase (P-type)